MKVTMLARTSASAMARPSSGSLADMRRVKRSRGPSPPSLSSARRFSMIASTAESKNSSALRPRRRLSLGTKAGGMDPADSLEIARHGALEGAGLAPEPPREQRLLKHFQSEARHDRAAIRHGSVAPPAHALDCGGSHSAD